MDVLVDTNVIVRSLHRTDPQHRTARQAIARLGSEAHRLCVTSQNLIELWAVCTRPQANNGLGLTPQQTDRILARVESVVFRVPDSSDVYAEWRRLAVTHGVSGKKAHDTRLVAAMNVHRIAHILTFNADDFGRYPDIHVINPTSAA